MDASKKKKTFSFPSAFTILFAILILAVGLTWVIPSGSYSKLTYNSTDNVFVVKAYGVDDKTYPDTTDTLDNLNIKIKLSNFTEGVIKKPIAIPGTYQRVEQHHKGIEDITTKALKTSPKVWWKELSKPLMLWSLSSYWGYDWCY